MEDSDNAVTSLEACETMYTEVEEDDTVIDDGEEGLEENGVVENEEEEETPSNIAFDDQNHNEIVRMLVRKSRDLASKFILRQLGRYVVGCSISYSLLTRILLEHRYSMETR